MKIAYWALSELGLATYKLDLDFADDTRDVELFPEVALT